MLTQIADQLWSLELTELVHRMEVLVGLLGTGGLPGGDSQLTQQVWRKREMGLPRARRGQGLEQLPCWLLSGPCSPSS